MTQSSICAAPGTIMVSADLFCPWARVAVHRLHATRNRLRLEDTVTLDHRAFPLEVEDRRPTPKPLVEAEMVQLAALEPDAGWQLWQAQEFAYPVTTLLALEAVQAAKEQSLKASEQLDYALRAAFFAHSRCISLRHVILDVAQGCDRLDASKLREALDSGRARRVVMDQYQEAKANDYAGSPHLFLPDGTHLFNPGIKAHWVGARDSGFPAIHQDDPTVYESLLRKAAQG